jgi:micrococcal nuclease
MGHDSYGRHIGRLSVNGVDLGAEMVRSGMAWAYRFRTGKGPYAALQRQAQKEKRGVFAGAGAHVTPLFRKFHGSCLAS